MTPGFNKVIDCTPPMTLIRKLAEEQMARTKKPVAEKTKKPTKLEKILVSRLQLATEALNVLTQERSNLRLQLRTAQDMAAAGRVGIEFWMGRAQARTL